jgi:hypothetical protein
MSSLKKSEAVGSERRWAIIAFVSLLADRALITVLSENQAQYQVLVQDLLV